MTDLADLLKNFLSPFVIAYVLGVISIPILIPYISKRWNKKIMRRRLDAGLDENILQNPETVLKHQRKQTITELLVFIILACSLPCFIILFLNCAPSSITKPLIPNGSTIPAEIDKINIAFVTLLLWTLVSGTTIAKNFLGGLAFRAVSILSNTIQVGDRITVLDYHGVVRDIGIFYTRIETFDQDLISIPSSELLSATISSTNDGCRSSLCVIKFHLDSQNCPDKRQKAEDIIWESIQSSVLFDFAHPLKILHSQTPISIIITAKVHVASTYDEPEFKSEITKRVLNNFHTHDIKLTRHLSSLD